MRWKIRPRWHDADAVSPWFSDSEASMRQRHVLATLNRAQDLQALALQSVCARVSEACSASR